MRGNSKFEIRNSNQIRNSNNQRKLCFEFRHSNLIRISNFEFRILLILLFFTASARSSPWLLTDSQFQTSQVSIDSIDSAGIHSDSSVIPWQTIVEITRPGAPTPAPAGRLSLIFQSGDHLAGDPASFNGDTLQWNAAIPQIGQISSPVGSLVGIAKPAFTPPDLDQTRTDDVIHLANGDAVHGIVTQIAAGAVTIQTTDGTSTPITWDSINAVLFSGSPSPPAHRAFRIRFAGDQAITVPDVSMSSSTLTLTLDDHSTRTLDPAAVSSIEQLNGPVTWLTSLKPSANIYKPFFSEDFPTRFDRTVADAKPITEKYPAFHHGIGCHSYSKLTYDLDPAWSTFRTQFAIDSNSPLADVTVRIYLDDKCAFEKKNVKAGRIFQPVMLPLSGAKTISLEVDYGENYATEDRFVWLDPALMRQPPAESTAQPSQQEKKRPVLAVTPASSIRLPDLLRSETHSLSPIIGQRH
jgi:hypothetical protein